MSFENQTRLEVVPAQKARSCGAKQDVHKAQEVRLGSLVVDLFGEAVKESLRLLRTAKRFDDKALRDRPCDYRGIE
jgi:hypothetical protein